MTIKQLNATYFVHEDRILWRFNTQNQEEFRFWLTRRVALFILGATAQLLTKKMSEPDLPSAIKALHDIGTKAPIASEKKESAVLQSYEPGIHFPLGFDPLLVMDVAYSLTKNGESLAQMDDSNFSELEDVVSLDFALPGSTNLNLKLPIDTLYAMTLLLDQLRKQANWGESSLQVKDASAQDSLCQMQSHKNISIH